MFKFRCHYTVDIVSIKKVQPQNRISGSCLNSHFPMSNLDFEYRVECARSQLVSYLSQVIMYLSQVIMYLSQVIMYLSQVIMYLSQVIMDFYQSLGLFKSCTRN